MIATAVSADDLDNRSAIQSPLQRVYSPKVYILFSSACAPSETASLLSLLFVSSTFPLILPVFLIILALDFRASGTPVMSLKAELETWAAALKAYDEEDFEKALEFFSVRLLCHNFLLQTYFPDFKRIADSSKILTNMGLIYATLGEHEAAVERFIEATNLDQYLAVALVSPDHNRGAALKC